MLSRSGSCHKTKHKYAAAANGVNNQATAASVAQWAAVKPFYEDEMPRKSLNTIRIYLRLLKRLRSSMIAVWRRLQSRQFAGGGCSWFFFVETIQEFCSSAICSQRLRIEKAPWPERSGSHNNLLTEVIHDAQKLFSLLFPLPYPSFYRIHHFST